MDATLPYGGGDSGGGGGFGAPPPIEDRQNAPIGRIKTRKYEQEFFCYLLRDAGQCIISAEKQKAADSIWGNQKTHDAEWNDDWRYVPYEYFFHYMQEHQACELMRDTLAYREKSAGFILDDWQTFSDELGAATSTDATTRAQAYCDVYIDDEEKLFGVRHGPSPSSVDFLNVRSSFDNWTTQEPASKAEGALPPFKLYYRDIPQYLLKAGSIPCGSAATTLQRVQRFGNIHKLPFKRHTRQKPIVHI